MGVLSQIRIMQTDISGVKLVLVGGIDPATGKERQGLAQRFDGHIGEHHKRERRNLAIVTALASVIAYSAREIAKFFHVG